MSENARRSTLVKKLRPLDAMPVEVKGRKGVPDINHRYGWIEVKFKPKWPGKQKADHIIKWPHKLLSEQEVWLNRRVRRGGQAVVCGVVQQTWFFWNVATFDLKQFDNQTRAEMYSSADLFFERNLEARRLITWLSNI